MLDTTKLLAAINALNSPPVPFTLDNVVLGIPIPNADNPPWNTKISISAVPGYGYADFMFVYYHRIDLADLGQIELVSDYEFTPQSVILAINMMLGTQLTEGDLEGMSIPTMDAGGDAGQIVLTAKPSAIGWLGTSSVTLAYNLPDVSELFEFLNVTLPSEGYLP